MRKLHDEVGWRGYCRTIALGSGSRASAAALCQLLKATTPSAARREIEQKLTSGEMDSDRYRTYAEAIETLEDMFEKGIQTHIVDVSIEAGWKPLGDGGHQRLTHLGGHG